MGRQRACAAVLRETSSGLSILMVNFRSFWTLPGGGLDPGETWEDAAVRELAEETHLRGAVDRLLYTRAVGDDGGIERCYLLRVDPKEEATLGHDPELPLGEQELHGIAWQPVADLADDVQVALVLAARPVVPICEPNRSGQDGLFQHPCRYSHPPRAN